MTISNPLLSYTPNTGYLEVSVSSTDMNGKPVILVVYVSLMLDLLIPTLAKTSSAPPLPQ